MDKEVSGIGSVVINSGLLKRER